MCGICGLINANPEEKVSTSLLASMCRTIFHRGPDDEGIYVHKNVGLGTRRLSIIDVAGGHQPLANEDGTKWIAYNGEVYNFLELQKELKARGHTFKTRTDTETILHCYEEWGEEFARKLQGMFAVAIWDGREKKLLLVRDRLGIKPLYYTMCKNNTLVFGSELKAVLAFPGIKRSIEPQALDYFLTLEYIPAPFSIFKNIFKLPAGNLLTYSRGRINIKKYWELKRPHHTAAKKTGQTLNSLMDELYSLLKESVKMRLISDVPLGAFLSGGIDSSAIVGLMRELGASPLKTFSIGFEDQTYNELDHARRVARKFDTNHEEFILQPQALELTEKLIQHLDEPFGDFSIFPTYLISKMARQHVKVILSGDGGDELFAGYEHYQAQKLSQNPLLYPARKILPPLVRQFPPSPKKKGLWNKLQRYCQGFEHKPELRHLRWMMFNSIKDKQSLYSDNLIQELDGIKEINQKTPFREIFSRMNDFDKISGELFLDLNTYLIDDILVKVDRMSMAASLETRVPLIDHKIVEFIFRLPGDLKLKGLTTKWLLKKTMERLLPTKNIYRKKEGFSIPIKHWLKTELKDLMLDHLNEKRIKEEGLFHFPAIRAKIDAHLRGSANYSHQLWSLLVFHIWKDKFLG